MEVRFKFAADNNVIALNKKCVNLSEAGARIIFAYCGAAGREIREGCKGQRKALNHERDVFLRVETFGWRATVSFEFFSRIPSKFCPMSGNFFRIRHKL